MKRGWMILVPLFSVSIAFADIPPLLISPVAPFAHPDAVAENIQRECNLPAYQAEAVRSRFAQQNVPFTVAEKDEVPASGRYVQLRIESAYSSGNAGIGHRKQVTTSARLFENGKEVEKFVRTRNSKGGVFGGFQGSCKILERCADALAADIAKWTQRRLNVAGSSSASETEPDEKAAQE